MGSAADILRRAMESTRTSQTALARMSGVHQPSISQVLHGKIDMSDQQLDRLLACMGLQLQVERRAVTPTLTRSERRSWLLHRELAQHLDATTFVEWRPALHETLDFLRSNVTGQPHATNIQRWQQLIDSGDLRGIHRALTGLDRRAIEMREIAPFRGLLPEAARRAVLKGITNAS